MKRNPISISALSVCNRSRQIWNQLNELRGVATDGAWLVCDLKGLAERLGKLRDDLAMHYAHEWDRSGRLRQAAVGRTVSRGELALFLREQTELYGLVSDLAVEAERLLHATDSSPRTMKRLMSLFKAFDALLISHETRKAVAVSSRS